MDTIPSVRAIKAALERVIGAIKNAPETEDPVRGSDPGTLILQIDLTRESLSQFDAKAPDRLLDDDVVEVPAEPNVIFEVPPSLSDAEVKNVLGDDIGEIRRLSQVKGIDAYGWYVSFHQRARQHGIYLPAERILAFACEVFSDVVLPLERKVELAFHAVLRHELFHFEADCMAANWELSIGEAVYWPNRAEEWLGDQEEGLANAYLLRGFRYPEGALGGSAGCYRALKAFCERQPPGYRDGPRYASSRATYVNGCRDLSFAARSMVDSAWELSSDALDTLIFYPNPFRIDWRRCPILVPDERGIFQALGIGVSFFETITGVVESQSFRKALAKLGSQIEEKWHRRKADLARSVNLNGLGFQRWKPGGPDCYSMRLNGNFRVHLRHSAANDTWIAEQVGDHKSMGHR